MHLLFVRGQRFRTDGTLWLMVGFLVVLMLSSMGAVEKGIAMQRVLAFVLEGLVLYWLVINVIRSERVLRRVIWILVAAGALLSALSLYQDVTGSYTQEFGGLAYRNYVETVGGEEPTGRSKWDRAQGPVDEPNRFAQILIVLVPLALLCYRSGRSRFVRLCAAGAGLLILAGIGITLSRGAFVGLVLMGFAMVKARWLRPAHLVAGLAACIVSMSVLSPDYLPRILSIVNVKHLAADNESDRKQADGAIRGRMTSMLTAAHVFRSKPVLGVGPGQFRFHYMDTYEANPETAFRVVSGPRRAHNLYLELGAESGILGLAVFMAIMIGLMRALWRMRGRWLKQSESLADLTTAFWLSFLAYMVTGVFLHLSYQSYYWFLVAMASATLHVLYTRPGAVSGELAGAPAAGVTSRSVPRPAA
jgi:O-antigen ligase